MTDKAKKRIKITAIVLLCIIGAVILAVASYVVYVVASYKRIDDRLALVIDRNSEQVLSTATSYKAVTYNVGFGAYSQDFSFFLDSGEMLDGKKITGSGSKAKSAEEVKKNTNGAIDAVKPLNADFVLLQEVDVKSDRARKVNMYKTFSDSFSSYAHTFAVNFDSAYLMYPLFDHHGKSLAGLATYSKYKIDNAERRSLPLSDGFAKFFDLDRCFSVNSLPVEGGKKLTLINVHLSAYDKGGIIRKEQLKMINEFLAEEKAAGNYVILGGDFNHDISLSIENPFATKQKRPEWVYTLTNEDLTQGFTFETAVNAPTCRSSDMAYTKGVNFTVVIDGFIVSDNIRVTHKENIDNDFMYSDHQPATITFELK